jgi:predicted Zn-dependent protease
MSTHEPPGSRKPRCGTLVAVVAGALAAAPAPAPAAGTEDLPDIGAPWDSVLSQSEEYQIGRMIVHRLREAGQLFDDPELGEYLQTVGHRLSGQAQEGTQRFEFFLVRDGTINAFALPGGYIGVNTGLLLATESESELAGVLAHEIAHVTQRHIARMAQSQGQAALATTAGIIAAILLGAATGMGDDAVQAALAVAQGVNLQKQIDFTRVHEAEADRVGLGVLHQAGYDPFGMPAFFEKLGRRSAQSQVPEFLLTHPVTTSRIAETRERASRLEPVEVRVSDNYALMRARLVALAADTPEEAISDFTRLADGDLARAAEPIRYGYAVALLRAGRAAEAVPLMRELLAARQDLIAYHVGLGQALLGNRQTGEALRIFAQALELFPRNVPLTTHYSQALIETGEPEQAHAMLLDLLNNIDYTPEQVHLIALAANAAGNVAEAHYYMAELHVINGDLPLAMRQLELALATPGIEAVQRSRFEARMGEIRQHLPARRPRRGDDGNPGPSA